MIEKIIKDYSQAFKENGDSPKSVMWPKGRQNERFEALLRFTPKKDFFSLLDFGCGLAHLIQFLENNYNKFNYTGCDIVEEFIKHNRIKYRNYKFFNSLEENISENYDYIVVSGAFNLLYSKDENEHKKIIKDTIKLLFRHTNKCLLINFMTDKVDFISPNAYHQNVVEIYNFCSNQITRRLNLDQTYMPYEFTLALFADQEIQSFINIYNKHND